MRHVLDPVFQGVSLDASHDYWVYLQTTTHDAFANYRVTKMGLGKSWDYVAQMTRRFFANPRKFASFATFHAAIRVNLHRVNIAGKTTTKYCHLGVGYSWNKKIVLSEIKKKTCLGPNLELISLGCSSTKIIILPYIDSFFVTFDSNYLSVWVYSYKLAIIQFQFNFFVSIRNLSAQSQNLFVHVSKQEFCWI